eukprot:SAG11_NODE_14644_length_604_cov_4.192079_1_plen_123_part_00
MDDRDIVAHKSAGDFMARIHSIDREVHERMLLTRQYAEKHFNKKLRGGSANALLVPGAYAWFSSEGITMHAMGQKPPISQTQSKILRAVQDLGIIRPSNFQAEYPNEVEDPWRLSRRTFKTA